jgi:hypothetical protein
MSIRTCRGAFAAVLAALAGTGCVVLPMHAHIADAAASTPVYERCSLTPDLPAGVRLERAGVQAVVSIVREQGGLVRVQFDVPEGTIVALRENTFRIEARDGTPPRLAFISHVNPVSPARSPETAVIQKLVIAPDAPLQGGRLNLGRASSDRHYWIAAPLGELPSGDLWVTLPEIAINGAPTRFEAIHFERRFVVGTGLFNC